MIGDDWKKVVGGNKKIKIKGRWKKNVKKKTAHMKQQTR